MTERLYYTDAYLREFQAKILEAAEGGRRIYLDRTAFYPTSGGQPFDTGRLNGIEVTDVIDEGDRIAHILAAPLDVDRVAGEVDWDRRFDHMQQHTGQHLLSAVLAELFGFATVSVHFGRENSTLDLDTSSLSGDQAGQAELRANKIVAENRPVDVSFETADAATGLRKVSGRTGTLRIVSIRDLDRSACGGTHVRATGEIGAILIRKLERVRQLVRVEFVCGQRAVRRARADYALISGLAADFSAAPEELPGILESKRQEIKEVTAARKELQAAWDLCRAKELYAGTAPGPTGIRRVVMRDSTESLDALRALGQAFASMPMVVFVGTVTNPPGVVLAASPDVGINAGGVLKGLLATVGGRGGGSPSVAQGIAPGRAQLETVVASIIS